MRVCFIFNHAPRYVESSYVLFDSELDAKWCFGTNESDIKDMDHSLLKDVTIYPTKRGCFGTYSLEGVTEVAKDNNIGAYVIIGDFRLIDTWRLPRLIRCYNSSAKILYWTHGWYGKESKLKAWIKKIYFNLADGVLLYGNYARKLMIEHGISADKLYTIHNSLHHRQQVILRNKMKEMSIYKNHFGNTSPVLLFIGRLTPVKKLDMLVEALRILTINGYNYNLVFVGDGSEKLALEQKVKSYDLESKVWFYGACYDEALNAELIYNADLCVAPGNIGLTAMHSLVFGCPALSHNDFKWQMPEFEAIIPGKTGDFFEYNDVNSLADTINKWFKEHDGKRDEIRKACYKEIDENWTPEFELNVLKTALSINN